MASGPCAVPLVLGHHGRRGDADRAGSHAAEGGDAVVMSIVPSCGGCPACVRGRRNYCQTAGRAMSRGGLLDGSLRLSRNGLPLHHFLTVSLLHAVRRGPRVRCGGDRRPHATGPGRAHQLCGAHRCGRGPQHRAGPAGDACRGLRVRRDRPQRRPGSPPGRRRPHRRDRRRGGEARPGAGSARPMSSTRARRIRPRRSAGS